MLQRYQGHPASRQVFNESLDPPSLILKCLDDDVLPVSEKLPLTTLEIKYMAKTGLEALAAMHEGGLVHMGMSQTIGGCLRTVND